MNLAGRNTASLIAALIYGFAIMSNPACRKADRASRKGRDVPVFRATKAPRRVALAFARWNKENNRLEIGRWAGDASGPHLVTIYWGYSPVRLGTNVLRQPARLPILGAAFLGPPRVYRSHTDVVRNADGVRAKVSASCVCYPVSPVADPNLGGVLEVLPMPLTGPREGESLLLPVRFPELAADGDFAGLRVGQLSPRYAFLLECPSEEAKLPGRRRIQVDSLRNALVIEVKH